MPTEEHNAHSGQGPVVLDIGDGVGALVLHASAEDAGAEIEISSIGSQSRCHVAVLTRHLAGRTVHAAVYPALPAGEHQLWDPVDGAPAMRVTIRSAQVTQARWVGSRGGSAAPEG